jgi:hypothetical protein
VGADALLAIRNNKVFNAKISYRVQVIFECAPVAVYSSQTRIPNPIYGGLLAIGASGKGFFYPAWVAACYVDWSTFSMSLFIFFFCHVICIAL